MSALNNNKPAEAQETAANKGVSAELSDNELKSLVSYFDTLIRMDFALKIKQELRRKDSEENNLSAEI